MSNVTQTHIPGDGPTEAPKAEVAEVVAEKPKAKQSRGPAITKAELAAAGPLPHQSEVDTTKIERAVLTSEGWVVPAPKPNPLQRL